MFTGVYVTHPVKSSDTLIKIVNIHWEVEPDPLTKPDLTSDT